MNVKRRILKIFKNIAFVFLITCSVGCINNIEDVTGTVQTNVSFSADVQPIMQQHCVGCHNNNFANNNLTFSPPDNEELLCKDFFSLKRNIFKYDKTCIFCPRKLT